MQSHPVTCNGAQVSHRLKQAAMLRLPLGAARSQNFGEFGPVRHIHIVPSKTIAFVKYHWRVSAEFAREAMDQQQLTGSTLNEVGGWVGGWVGGLFPWHGSQCCCTPADGVEASAMRCAVEVTGVQQQRIYVPAFSLHVNGRHLPKRALPCTRPSPLHAWLRQPRSSTLHCEL